MNKTCLFQTQYATSLERLVADFGQPDYRGARVEVWSFDGFERRKRAEDQLIRLGVKAHIRSAFKPLIHAILEDVEVSELSAITIHYPVLESLPENRFLLEAYPVFDLLSEVSCQCVAKACSEDDTNYDIVAQTLSGERREWSVFAPNSWRDSYFGRPTNTPCGWIRVTGTEHGKLDRDEPFSTDLEQAFDSIMQCLQNQTWIGESPFFDRLEMRVKAPFFERALKLKGSWESERISSAEMMHEELYFSALELLKVKNGLEETERTFGPGQLVPITENGDDETIKVEVRLTAEPRTETENREGETFSRSPAQSDPLGMLDTATHWLTSNEVKASLDALGGDQVEGQSRRGRSVWSRHFAGNGPGLLLTSGQHANETSGTVGALRAARRLVKAGKHNLFLTPQVNPDGFALFEEYCQRFPTHMNHAARFTAGGNDLEFMARGYENEVLYKGVELTKADFHLNLHGYPSHEWNRPFNGYIPHGYADWTLPKGFMLILRHHPDWKATGRKILEKVVERLHHYQPVVDINKEQLERYQKFVPNPGFELMGDIPCYLVDWPDGLCPVTMITEAPDETIYGDAFVVQHTAQMLTVLAAAEAI